jgi:hypothetical protein
MTMNAILILVQDAITATLSHAPRCDRSLLSICTRTALSDAEVLNTGHLRGARSRVVHDAT